MISSLLFTFVSISVFISVTSTSPLAASDGVVACFYGSWARYRPGHGSVAAEDLDPTGCTHLIYTFAGLDPKTNEIISLDPWNDLPSGGGYGSYEKATDLKYDYPGLLVTLCIGGSTQNPNNYASMAHDPDARATFISSVVSFLKRYNFDGLDLDWLSPSISDKDAYTHLVTELKEALAEEDLILTVTIPVSRSIVKNGYDLAKIGPVVDLIHIMTYNYHSIYDNVVGANAPINEILSSIDDLVDLGAPVNKLATFLPLFGTANILRDENDAEIGSRIDGGFHGPWTAQDGIIAYNEICNLLSDGGWTHDTDAKTNTAIERKEIQMIVYDNADTITSKAQQVLKKGVAGVALWALEMDDAYDDCGDGTFPLSKAAGEAVSSSRKIIYL